MALLQDKVVLVTGAGAGIGKATALAMAEAGATVAAADIDAAAAARTVAEIASNTRRALAIEADCGDLASIDAMISRMVEEFGRLDMIVNNAGVTRFAAIMDLTEADWDRIHRVNAKGVFFCLQRAAREMIAEDRRRAHHQYRLDLGPRLCRRVERRLLRQQGRGHRADPEGVAGAGAAQHQRQRDLSRRDPHRIGGAQRRRQGRPARHADRGAVRRAGGGIPIRRANTPDDIAAMAVFLASPAARNITGQSYNVDGGLVPS